MKFVRLAATVGQSHRFELHVLEVAETRGCRGLGIETAVAELFVPLVHRAIIDDLEARRATTTTLALDFPHDLIPRRR
jgi:hypothetical protein